MDYVEIVDLRQAPTCDLDMILAAHKKVQKKTGYVKGTFKGLPDEHMLYGVGFTYQYEGNNKKIWTVKIRVSDVCFIKLHRYLIPVPIPENVG